MVLSRSVRKGEGPKGEEENVSGIEETCTDIVLFVTYGISMILALIILGSLLHF